MRADEMRRKASRVFLVLKSFGLICLICFASAAFAQNRYQITRIPTAQGASGVALGIIIMPSYVVLDDKMFFPFARISRQHERPVFLPPIKVHPKNRAHVHRRAGTRS